MIIPGARNRPVRKIVGCTMAGPAFMRLAEAARDSFEAVTGMRCILVKTLNDQNYAEKFKLHENFDDDETVIYFDADTRWVKPFNPLQVTTRFGGVLDPGRASEEDFPIHDCRRLGMPWQRYINSGVMVFNSSHRRLWKECKELYGNVDVDDFGEQSVINLCLHRMKVQMDFLSPKWNYGPICIPTGRPQKIVGKPYVIHAMGYKQEKTNKRLTPKEAVLNLWEAKYMI